MIPGIILSTWGFLCLYLAFFTNNKYCLFWATPMNLVRWKMLLGVNANKGLNILGGILLLFAGLIFIKH
jgi:hypothetical protein